MEAKSFTLEFPKSKGYLGDWNTLVRKLRSLGIASRLSVVVPLEDESSDGLGGSMVYKKAKSSIDVISALVKCCGFN